MHEFYLETAPAACSGARGPTCYGGPSGGISWNDVDDEAGSERPPARRDLARGESWRGSS
jgi:hypothetical protein